MNAILSRKQSAGEIISFSEHSKQLVYIRVARFGSLCPGSGHSMVLQLYFIRIEQAHILQNKHHLGFMTVFRDEVMLQPLFQCQIR